MRVPPRCAPRRGGCRRRPPARCVPLGSTAPPSSTRATPPVSAAPRPRRATPILVARAAVQVDDARNAAQSSRDARADRSRWRRRCPTRAATSEMQAVHPAGRAGVPGPAAAAGVRRDRIDVGGDHVRLDLVDRRRPPASAAWLIGLIMREQFPRALAVAQRRERHRRPDRGVRVLAAVLAHAGHVAADIARIERRFVERRSRAAGSVRRRAAPVARRPRPSPARARVGSPAPDSTAQLCAIESIWHSALSARAERRAVVEIGAPIPFAIPGVVLDAPASCRASLSHALRERSDRRAVAPGARTRRSTWHRKKPSHTLSPLPCVADEVHAVVPVARADQRQTVRAESQSMQRSRARSAGRRSRSRRTGRQVVIGVVAPALTGPAFEKVDATRRVRQRRRWPAT